MASGSKKETGSNLLNIGTLALGTDDLHPWGVVVVGDKLVITDMKSKKIRVYRRHDGMLMSSSDQLESTPCGLCCVNDTDLCVAMRDGTIILMSVQDSGLISRGKTFHLPSFNRCHGVAAFRDNVVVSGVKDNTICWCVVPLQDGRHHNLHKVCRGRVSFLTTKENMAYISCHADSIDDSGVYGFNLLNPSQPRYTYKPKGLSWPLGITVDDNGDLFVCDYKYSHSIHHLTEKCQLVGIFTEGIPRLPVAIFWDSGILYVSSDGSNVITLYRTPHQAIPAEILRMNNQSIQLFKEAMKDGEAKVFNIRVMVVGHLGVGKTTLIKRFLEKEVNINERQSTEGIIVHVHCCKVSQDGSKWTLNEGDLEQNLRLQRLAKVLNDQVQKRNLTDKRAKQVEIIYQREGNGRVIEIIYQREKKDHAGDDALPLQPVSQDIQSSSEPDKFPSNQSNEQGVKEMESAAGKISDDPAMEMLKLLHAKADKLKQETDIPLTMVDFAGHFAFYTTHQTFLTDRAIYLLVSDISKQVTDPVTDDCYFDTEGIKLCKVYELVEVWLNSIHSCTPSPGAKTPPVILVGTHVDQIQQDSREEVCQRYFRQIRYEYLGSKPTIVHLADEDFAIDNTVIDQKLDELKQKIIQLASEQPYWGQAIPVRWLTLEEHLMSLKAAGVKVIPYSLLEEMNQKEAVKIESREELDLFLKFQHDIGNILYFGTEGLKDQILLDPQWLIYSLRTIITAEEFILKKLKTPAIIQKWREFKETGKLTQELIDAIWTKENNPDCHANKDLIVCLMEKLNIIARPRSFIKDGDEVKEENYFIAPCMLREKTPQEIICPKPHPQMDNSSVLCYVFLEKFLPAPIFHRLLAACIAHWPIATQNKENQIFCGCGVFQLPQNHKLTIHFREHVIFVRVARKGIKDKTPSPKLCMEVRELITTMLIDIIGNLGQNLKSEYCIQCPECNSDTVNGLFPVSQLQENAEVECDFHDMIESHKLLSCWFEEVVKDQEGQGQDDVDAPITQEQINHARLCNALTTVCANALRNILLTNVPAAHTDIYQAILANKSSLKRLNKDQYQLVFPDPQGLSTGKVEEFDISLLYTIIRNVSSVPAPSNGWGNPPATNPRDTTLGASVERIRSYRNSISGHSVGGEIGQHEFEDYWAKIDEVLHEIEIVIGNHGYLEDLEKRRNQVITPHEARELQKTFQEYKKQTEAAATGILSALETALSEAKKLQGNKN